MKQAENRGSKLVLGRHHGICACARRSLNSLSRLLQTVQIRLIYSPASR